MSRPSSSGVHVLIHPSAIRSAPPLLADTQDGASLLTRTSESLDAYLQDVLTVPASLAGLPALSVPAGTGSDGWPIGISIVGQWGCENMILQIGGVIQEINR